MNISQIKGLRYPDEYLIKFFFKSGLQRFKGSVLELGCSNGNNLLLFYQYGWDVKGIDFSKTSIEMANSNFSLCKNLNKLNNSFEFFCSDIEEYVNSFTGKSVDVLLLPSCIYYLSHSSICTLFENIKKNKILKEGGWLFIRYRSKADYRYNKGQKIEKDSFKFDFDETGELGRINTFFDKDEMQKIVDIYFNQTECTQLKSESENPQNGEIVLNSDFIYWGK